MTTWTHQWLRRHFLKTLMLLTDFKGTIRLKKVFWCVYTSNSNNLNIWKLPYLKKNCQKSRDTVPLKIPSQTSSTALHWGWLLFALHFWSSSKKYGSSDRTQAAHLGLFTPIQTRRERERRKGGRETEKRRLTKGDWHNIEIIMEYAQEDSGIDTSGEPEHGAYW